MQKQPDRVTALYYRTAQKNMDTLHLDNQMQQLLCYAREKRLDSYLLYVDNGFSGLNLDRPAFSALKADIEAGQVKEIVVKDISRIGRSYIDTMRFMDWAKSNGVAILSLSDDICTELDDAIRAFMKGGARK